MGKCASPLLQVAQTVFCSFLGVRKHAMHESDVAHLKPAQVIVAGIIGAAVLVVGLILLVRFIVTKAT